jgi:hypothetical protein
MKKAILFAFFCLLPLCASAHPGKTDKYGGHLCYKGCEEWRLFYKEYHLHDKEGKVIRVGKKEKGKTPVPAPPEPVSMPVETALTVDQPVTKIVTTYHYVTNVYEENLFTSNPLLYILLVLLLFLLIFRMNRKREEG